jgi:hypothetical protein
MKESSLHNRVWWGYLEEDLQELLKQSFLLVEIVDARGEGASSHKPEFHDYSFVVFPAAKAYEGFLKKIFMDRGFITSEDYYGKYFRIGKALNPGLDRKMYGQNVYDKIVKFCGTNSLADRLWETWKDCRNILFHWFPKEQNAIDFKESKARIEKIIYTMDETYGVCIAGIS